MIAVMGCQKNPFLEVGILCFQLVIEEICKNR